MLRGCQKKIVFLKNTGSKLFDEAYFVISDKAYEDKTSNNDMITEANRIIDECISDSDRSLQRSLFSKIKNKVKRGIIPFSLGVFISFGFIILFALFLK